jgi:hypothetical protein
MYDNLMHKFKFGGAQIPGTYFDEPNRRMLIGIRNAFAKLGIALAEEGKKDSAIQVLNYCDKHILQGNYPYAFTSPGNNDNISSLQTVYAYYIAGDSLKGDEIANQIINDCRQQGDYYNSLSPRLLSPTLMQDAQSANAIIAQLEEWKRTFGMESKKVKEMREKLNTIPLDSETEK